MAEPPADERQRQAWEEEADAAAGPSTELVFEGEPVPTLPEMITARSVAVGVVLGVVLSIVAMKLSLTAVYLPFLAIPAGLMSFFLSRWGVRLLYGCGVAQPLLFCYRRVVGTARVFGRRFSCKSALRWRSSPSRARRTP